ncbi:MAG TPA: cytochrome c [Dyadobacter sp.]|nr:cytochrome c [Dyadobacter sp.]
MSLLGFASLVFLAAVSDVGVSPLASKEVSAVSPMDTLHHPQRFGFGKPASAEKIAALDIDIRPDGNGLPAGSGNAQSGREIYVEKCSACHGASGTEGPNDRLVQGDTTSAKNRKIKSLGNYWPYATTVFDYVRRAMPFNAPGSLSDQEVYSLTAYLLHANGLISEKEEVNAGTLPKVVMPAKKYFVPDDREDGPVVK